jgi:3-oxoacyl-[acyl-carrier-protein] synthase-1
MRPIHLAGRALVSTLGMSLAQAVAAIGLRSSTPPSRYALAGRGNGTAPYYAIPYQADGWENRARKLIGLVAQEAQADRARQGALFVATSAMDAAAAEDNLRDMDFHLLASRIAEWLDWSGPVYLVSTACTSGINAMLSALELLRSGSVSDALILGIEMDNHLTVPGFAALQLLAQDRCRPFAADRDGLILGEAVSALHLSAHETSSWRILGGANVVDGSQPTGATQAAVVEMCQRALRASGVDANQIDLIKVQAAGSPLNDAVEAAAMRQVFPELPGLVSLKPHIGHCMGASGIAEIALLLSCLEQGAWPVCPDAADPALEVRLATQAPRRVERLLATILGFGGSHACVVLERNPT